MTQPSFKDRFRAEIGEQPENYYPVRLLKKHGFQRNRCKDTGTYFWSTDEKRTVCGEPEVVDGFTFITEDIQRNTLSYNEVWSSFQEHMGKAGYTAIDRYPVVARWRKDADFVAASIYDFQPFVVSGEVEPPANPLVVPQFCLRFNDIENVGVTMSHTTGFVMIGQHAFVTEKEWNQEKYFEDLLTYFTDVVGIQKEDLVIHEDAWVGGGNFGPCLEFFCGGLELGNQVYMLYEKTRQGRRSLPIRVLDMGMGMERVAWFTSGEPTMYDAAFPHTVEQLIKKTGVEKDDEFLKQYARYAAFLNDDEVDDMEEAWSRVAKNLGVTKEEIKEKLGSLRAVYSVAEHARSIFVALSDGALPSNVKGGHNLRVILRRALRFIEDYDWDVTVHDVIDWLCEDLKGFMDDVVDQAEHAHKILGVEVKKYKATRKKQQKILRRVVEEKDFSEETFLELYDSHGIDPEDVVRYAAENDVEVEAPKQFFKKLTARHDEQRVLEEQEDSYDLSEVADTDILYYDHYDLTDFTAEVLHVENDEKSSVVVLNRTAFYPESGGQANDVGTINGHKVYDVQKQGPHVLHFVATADLDKGDEVRGRIDFDRRLQLTQHHTATHILTGAAKQEFGSHIWQAGAAKTEEKGRLDITHYDSLSVNDETALQQRVRDIINQNLPVSQRFMKRSVAEKKYGFSLYQGGAVPGKDIRVVEVQGYDVEACGGTHVEVTGDVGAFKILKSTKLQDGVVRLEYVAGQRAKNIIEKEKKTLSELRSLLKCEDSNMIPGRAEETFKKWKKIRKGKLDGFTYESEERFGGDVLDEAAKRLKTQPKHVVKTVKKFQDKIEDLLR